LPNRQFDPCPSRSLLEMIVGELIVEACPGSGVQRISPADDIGRQRRGQIYRRERSLLMPDTPFVYFLGATTLLYSAQALLSTHDVELGVGQHGLRSRFCQHGIEFLDLRHRNAGGETQETSALVTPPTTTIPTIRSASTCRRWMFGCGSFATTTRQRRFLRRRWLSATR
jgi:hypothetical protein